MTFVELLARCTSQSVLGTRISIASITDHTFGCNKYVTTILALLGPPIRSIKTMVLPHVARSWATLAICWAISASRQAARHPGSPADRLMLFCCHALFWVYIGCISVTRGRRNSINSVLLILVMTTRNIVALFRIASLANWCFVRLAPATNPPL